MLPCSSSKALSAELGASLSASRASWNWPHPEQTDSVISRHHESPSFSLPLTFLRISPSKYKPTSSPESPTNTPHDGSSLHTHIMPGTGTGTLGLQSWWGGSVCRMGRVHLQVAEAQARERAKGTCVKAQTKGLASLRNKKNQEKGRNLILEEY